MKKSNPASKTILHSGVVSFTGDCTRHNNLNQSAGALARKLQPVHSRIQAAGRKHQASGIKNAMLVVALLAFYFSIGIFAGVRF